MKNKQIEVLPAVLEITKGLDNESAQHIAEYLAADLAPSTMRVYASSIAYWKAWFELRYPFDAQFERPTPVHVILKFITDHAPRIGTGTVTMPPELDAVLVERQLKKPGPVSLGNLRRHLSALRWWNTPAPNQTHANPVDDPRIIAVTKTFGRVYSDAPHAKQKSGLLVEQIDAMLAVCDQEIDRSRFHNKKTDAAKHLRAVRDKAILLFGWSSGGRRRSEIANATMDRLTRTRRDGQVVYTYRLGRTKTNQDGSRKTVDKPLTGSAASALNEWLNMADIREGRIFRSLKNGVIGESISDRSIADMIKARADQAGLSGNFGGHSLRSGFITQANRNKVPVTEAMLLTDHRSFEQFRDYFRMEDALSSQAGKMFDQTVRNKK